MAQQTINVGAAPNDGTGTPLRTAFQYTNSNFSELYTATGPSGNNITVPGTATITGDLTVDTNVLKVDTSLNRVGIGTATPDSLLQMAGAGTINWKLSNTADSVTVGAYAGTTTGTAGTVSNHPFFLFTNNTERLRIDTSGNVGIGVASPAQKLDVAGSIYISNNAAYLYGKTSGGLATRTFGINAANDVYVGSIDQSINNIRFNSGGGDWAVLNSTGLGVGVASPAQKVDVNGAMLATNVYLRSDDSDVSWGAGAGSRPIIRGNQTNNTIKFYTASTDRMTLDASGRLLVGPTSANTSGGVLQLSSGITFPVTQVASSDANTLDDYKESTWTPTITAGTGTPTTVTVNSANYTKIGRIVVINIDFSVVAIGTAAGSLNFTLPFNHSGSSIPCGAFRENVSTGNMGQIYYGSGTTASCLMYNNATPWVNGYRIQGTYTYFSA